MAQINSTKILKIYKNTLKTQQCNTGVKSQKPFGKKKTFLQKAFPKGHSRELVP